MEIIFYEKSFPPWISDSSKGQILYFFLIFNDTCMTLNIIYLLFKI